MAAKKTVEKPRAYPKADSVARELSNQIVPVTRRHKVEVVEQKRKPADERQDRLRILEDEMLEQALDTMRHALSFASIPFDQTATPDELRALFGEKADTVFRTIKSAQMSAKDAPVGLLLAQRMAASIVKARSAEKQSPSQLNVAIQVVQSAPMFEELEVE